MFRDNAAHRTPQKKRMINFYLLLRPNTAPAAPNPARMPMTGAGEAPVCVGIGFTVGTSVVGATDGVGVGVAVGVGVSVSHIEEPCGVLLLTGVSYVSANGEQAVIGNSSVR